MVKKNGKDKLKGCLIKEQYDTSMAGISVCQQLYLFKPSVY